MWNRDSIIQEDCENSFRSHLNPGKYKVLVLVHQIVIGTVLLSLSFEHFVTYIIHLQKRHCQDLGFRDGPKNSRALSLVLFSFSISSFYFSLFTPFFYSVNYTKIAHLLGIIGFGRSPGIVLELLSILSPLLQYKDQSWKCGPYIPFRNWPLANSPATVLSTSHLICYSLQNLSTHFPPFIFLLT